MKFKFDYIESVWNNLEGSYQKYLCLSPNKSRLDYLKQLVAFNYNNTGATFYVPYLTSEITKYDNDTLARYHKLGETLDNVHEKLKTVPANFIIDNFDNFISEANLDKVTSDVKAFDLSKFSIIQPMPYVSAKTILSAGFFSDGVYCSEDHVNIYNLDPKDPDMVVLYTLYDCISLMDRASVIVSGDNEFMKKVLALCLHLGKEKKLYLPMTFVSSNCYIEDDKNLICGSHKFAKRLLIDNTATVSISINDTVVPVDVSYTTLTDAGKSNGNNVFFVR